MSQLPLWAQRGPLQYYEGSLRTHTLCLGNAFEGTVGAVGCYGKHTHFRAGTLGLGPNLAAF